MANDGDGFPRVDAEVEVIEHAGFIIAKTHVLENDFATHRLRVTAYIFVQICFRIDEFKDAFSAGNAHLHQVEGENRDKRGEAQRAQ